MRFPCKSPTTAPSLPSGRRAASARGAGFTLVELLVASAVFMLILVLVLSITSQTSQVWKRSAAKIEAFQGARAAYETITSRLRQATLNTYLDYYDGSSPAQPRTPANADTFQPAVYGRNSDLHFVVDRASSLIPGSADTHPGQAVFFLAPLAFSLSTANSGKVANLVNACGFYTEFNSDQPYFPPFLSGSGAVKERYRYRLMEFLQPAEDLEIYNLPSSGTASQYEQWFTNFLPPAVAVADAPVRVLAENIIAFIVLPELSPHDADAATDPIAPRFEYDSRAGDITTRTKHQLPPLLRVVMVAIDEPSAARLNPPGSTAPPAALGILGTLFKDAASLDDDLGKLSAVLNNNNINYRIFDTEVGLKGAKWSGQ